MFFVSAILFMPLGTVLVTAQTSLADGLAVVQTLFADDVHGKPQRLRGRIEMLPSAFTKFFHDCSRL